MTHIKYPNELGAPVPYEPNWHNEAMRQNALLHSAMAGGAAASKRAEQLELERDALLRVVTDNHVALCRAEDAEKKLAKAVAVLTSLANMKTAGDSKGAIAMAWHAQAVLAELEKSE